MSPQNILKWAGYTSKSVKNIVHYLKPSFVTLAKIFSRLSKETSQKYIANINNGPGPAGLGAVAAGYKFSQRILCQLWCCVFVLYKCCSRFLVLVCPWKVTRHILWWQRAQYCRLPCEMHNEAKDFLKLYQNICMLGKL